jgi:uncharacterized membrane protein/N-acetylneuraminic acid mutarotase
MKRKISLIFCAWIVLALLGAASLLLDAGRIQQAAAAPEPEAWTPSTNIPVPLAANLVKCPDMPDSFYMVGGILTGDFTSDTLYRFDIADEAWALMAAMPAPRRAVAAACYENKIYVAGGWVYGSKNSLFIYDIAENYWSIGPNLPRAVWGAALGAWDGKLYLVGGSYVTNSPYTPVGQIDVYDIASGQWTAGEEGDMPTAASFFGSTQVGQYLYAVGGFSGDINNNVDQTQRYDMRTDTWESGPTFTSARALGTLAASSSHLYYLGGDENGGGAFDATDLVEVLDLTAWPGGAWADLGDPLPVANIYPATTCSEALSGGEIWLVGGADAGLNPYDEVYYRTTGEACPDFSFGDLPREAWNLGSSPGGWATYTLPVINNGTVSDTYMVTVGSDWDAFYPGTIGPLEPDETSLLFVSVHIPASPVLDDLDTAVVSITSQSDPGAWDTAVLTTSVTDWQEAASLPIQDGFQASAQCVDDPNGFYILGGSTPSLDPSDDVYHYDASTDTWRFVTNLPVGGWGMAVTCYEDKLYVAGGAYTQRFDVYDIDSDTWTMLTYPPRQFYAAAMGAWDGKLYVAGGDAWTGVFEPTNQVNVYDIAGHTWSAGPAMPVASEGYGAVQAGPYLYVVGGLSGDWYNNLDITLRLNMATESWEMGPTFTSQRAIATLAMTADHLYALGGDINGGERLDPTGLVEVLDLSQWPGGEWTDISQPLPWTLEANTSACTEAVTGGEIWSVGGTYGTWEIFGTISNNYYLPVSEPCMSYGVELPEPWQGEGLPGETVEYELTITNTGTITDYYLLDAPTIWPAVLAGRSVSAGPGGPVGPGQSIQVIVAVDVPADALAGEQGVTEITATSMSNPDAQAVTTITTTVLESHGVDLSPEGQEGAGMPGESVPYTLTLTNLGNITDTFTLSYTGNLWEVSLSVMTATLEADGSAIVNVEVSVPAEAMAGEMDEVTISATSQAEPGEQDSAVLTTTAEAVYALSLEPDSQAASAAPGTVVEYLLTLTNEGNITDTFVLSYTGGLWEVSLPVTTTLLGAGESVEVMVYVAIPLDAADGAMDVLTLTATSQGDMEASAQAVLTTTAVWYKTYLPLVFNTH